MKRSPDSLKEGPFDVLVIGGGIYGSWIACHAACLGLKTALVEREDWGSGTSSASSKLLHGGLRYLEYFDFGLVRKSLGERRELDRRLPHHVRPLRFLLPVYRGARVGRVRLKMGLWLYDRLAGPHQPVGPHESYSAKALLQEEPALKEAGLTGGFSYGDCWTDDARMILEIVDTSLGAGAAAVNYIEARNMLVENGKVVGAEVQDLQAGNSFSIRARVTVNAAGPWAADLAGTERAAGLARLTKGVHLVMPPLRSGKALLLTAKSDGRVFFLIPWCGRTLLGTTDTDYTGDPDEAAVEKNDVDYLLRAAGEYLTTGWTPADMQGAYCGLRTLRNEEGKPASEVTREWGLEEPLPGLLMPVGGKYTSARVESLEVVTRVLERLDSANHGSTGGAVTMAWYPGDDVDAWQQRAMEEGIASGLDPETASICTERHGSTVQVLFERVRKQPELARRIVSDLPFCRAEVIHAVEHEMAQTLVDILRRRIPLLILSRLDHDVVQDVAGLAADGLGWSAERVEGEIGKVLNLKAAQCPA